MKHLLYLLVLVNVVFFLWETGFRQGEDSNGSYQELAIPSGIERIALTRELGASAGAESDGEEPAAQTAEEPKPAVPAKAESPAPESKARQQPVQSQCFQIGPWQTKAEAAGLLELMKSQTPEASVETKPGDVPAGWWVLFPKAETLEAARENRRALAEKGVKDMWLFDKGPLQGAISLGLFDGRERADAAQKRFMEEGIITTVTPRLVRGRVYWIRVPWHRPAFELEEILQVLASQDQSLHIPAPIPCE
jgi:hypothetical protein